MSQKKMCPRNHAGTAVPATTPLTIGDTGIGANTAATAAHAATTFTTFSASMPLLFLFFFISFWFCVRCNRHYCLMQSRRVDK